LSHARQALWFYLNDRIPRIGANLACIEQVISGLTLRAIHIGSAIDTVGKIAGKAGVGNRLQILPVCTYNVFGINGPHTNHAIADNGKFSQKATSNAGVHIETVGTKLRTTEWVVGVHAYGALVLVETLCAKD
jgi:hypothetical protein